MNYQNLSDEVLFQYCREDDMKAYNELFKRYFPRMLRLAFRYVPDKMKAEELCMDVLFELWAKRSQILINSSFSGYLFRSVRNIVITHLRKRTIELTELSTLPDGHQTERPADYDLLSEEAEQAYRSALDELSPQRRQVFILSREENLTYAEIARKMGLSVNTVENYMVAALSSLRSIIKESSVLTPLLICFLCDFFLHA